MLGVVEEDDPAAGAVEGFGWTCRWSLDFVRVRPILSTKIDLFLDVIERWKDV